MRTNVSDEAWELLKSQTAPLQLPAKARQRNAAAITRLDGDLRKQHTHTQQSIGQPQRKSMGGARLHNQSPLNALERLASTLTLTWLHLSERGAKEEESGDKSYEER